MPNTVDCMDTPRTLFLLLGLIALLFGILAVVYPAVVLVSLVIIVGIIFLLLGIIMAGIGISDEPGIPRSLLIAGGLLGIIIGLIALISPYIATIAIGLIIGIWILVTAVVSISRAVAYKWMPHRVLLGLVGVLGLIVAFFVIFNPVGGTVAIMWVVGIYFIVIGLVAILEGLFFWKKGGGASAAAAPA
jgi:uncharacterized membrane protein HdeD (DUF308 family)